MLLKSCLRCAQTYLGSSEVDKLIEIESWQIDTSDTCYRNLVTLSLHTTWRSSSNGSNMFQLVGPSSLAGCPKPATRKCENHLEQKLWMGWMGWKACWIVALTVLPSSTSISDIRRSPADGREIMGNDNVVVSKFVPGCVECPGPGEWRNSVISVTSMHIHGHQCVCIWIRCLCIYLLKCTYMYVYDMCVWACPQI